MKRKALAIIKIGLILTIILPSILIANYMLINSCRKLPYKNITDRLGYIYVDVIHNHDRYTILTTGSSFYGNQRYYGKKKETGSFVSNFVYVLKTYYAIKLNLPIRINDEENNIMLYDKVNMEKIKFYKNQDLLNSGYFKKCSFDSNALVFSDNIEDARTIMYLLLKKRIMDCRIECESGIDFFIPCNK